MTDQPLRLPIKLDSTSNGEFAPVPLGAVERQANEAAWRVANDSAKRTGVKRRGYLASVCGAAATLFAFDQVFAAAGRTAGRYVIDEDARFDTQLAQAQVGGDEFIFDVQLHHVTPTGAWRTRPGNNMRGFVELMPYSRCGESDPLACLSRERLLKDVFLDSDTSMAVLSHVPATEPLSPLTHDEALATKRIVDAMDGSERLLLHAPVNPREPGSLDRMQQYAQSVKLAAFKTYTQFDPDPAGPGGFWLDDEKFGLPMIEQARKLGVRNICIHKGLPLSSRGVQFSGCRDIGVVAKRYPDMNFIVYHSGFQPARGERAFDAQRPSGVDDLVMSLQANGVAPNANVYAELGTTWRYLMRNPEQGAHLLGKLFKHVGENNVLWGTDSIWYGSPQDQIQAFRAFQIAPQSVERQGYPALTPELKRKVFGRNGARVYGLDEKALRPKLAKDAVRKARDEYLPRANPDFATHGPRTRREFIAFKQAERTLP